MEFTAGYDHYYRGEGTRGHLWEFNPILYLPLGLGSYAQVTPWAGFRGSVWERSDSAIAGGDKSGSREVIQLGAVLSTEIGRVFTVGGDQVEKIRHGIKPEIAYQYIPAPSGDRAPDFLETIEGKHVLTYALTNTILARIKGKDGKTTYRELLRFKLAQTYDIQEVRREAKAPAGDNRPFGAVDVELDLAPLPYFSLAARNRYDLNAGNWLKSNYDLTLSDSRGDTASAGYRYTRDVLEEINLSLKAVLTQSLAATYLLRRNQFERRTVEAAYGLNYRKQCWNVELNVTEREDDRTVMVVFSLYGIGKGGAW
jgi:LPS-assembly protein